MGFWPYLRHAHGSDDDAPPSATGISRTTFFSWLFLLHQINQLASVQVFMETNKSSS